ncbi:excisionase [Rathayibacter rathayi]|uniref:helix-turn-helix domain-containing protein n=1 Tax=Rathayibacter rathayi TaxID=33887 RepID=UPI000CE75064|nr:helix-turn-helix domain-containing protein [Rathayibacter rathayi]PPG65625.1 excisionase [Rathayibacter rathayi]PPG73405.1 excisionase [Rathayibacter rathayi]PPH19489.1 excisionase [Rathayibacter rathayi]PPI75441.1 excisionase [Rathayibacter rathayi]
MPTDLLSAGAIATFDSEIRDDARSTEQRLGDREVASLLVRTGDGEFELPDGLRSFLMSIVGRLADGAEIGISTLPEELTTTTTAQRLGISRPTLMKFIRNGQIPSYKVGTHTRINRSVLNAFIEQRQQDRHEALASLAAIDATYEETD